MGLLDKVRGMARGKVKSGDQVLDAAAPVLRKVGLDGLLKKFDAAGLADKAVSWVNKGPNDELSPDEVEKALGKDEVANIAKKSGTPVEEVKAKLSKQLPKLVDQLTPDGKVPAAGDVSKMVKNLDFGKILGG